MFYDNEYPIIQNNFYGIEYAFYCTISSAYANLEVIFIMTFHSNWMLFSLKS